MFLKKSKEDSTNAMKVALKLLARKWYSRKKIGELLLKKGISYDVIEETLNALKEQNYIDDEKFGYIWATYKVEHAPIGSKRIEWKLKEKGLEPEVISNILEKLWNEYNEYQVALSLAEKRGKTYKEGNRKIIQRKIVSYLSYRGFSYEIIDRIIKDI